VKAQHAAALAAFVGLAIAWSWPLAVHLGDALPGDPGDNFSFVWNLWWMRHVLATPGLSYFHTSYLFYPFGTSIANHPHTALPALVAATVLRSATPVAAQNILILIYLAANLVAAYALAWAVTRHVRASIAAAIVFGVSPYVAVHMLGHFDLVAVFSIPIYALALRTALGSREAPRRSRGRLAWVAGAILAATAYIAYYHVVYLAFFTIVYLYAWVDPLVLSRAPRAAPRANSRLRGLLWIAAAGFVGLAIAITATGGWSFSAFNVAVPVHTPQNALTAAWLFAIAAAISTWRPSIRVVRVAAPVWSRAAGTAARIAVAFVIGSAPLLWHAARLVARGEYVTPEYGWRSIPHGVDLLAPLIGHPLHPLYGAISRRAYAAIDQNFIEVVGWFGIVPLVVLAAARSAARGSERTAIPVAPPAADPSDVRIWRTIAAVFFIWSLGPFLLVAGFDTGLKLPGILLRYVPLVANARMPGRAIVMVYLAVAVLVAINIGQARGRLRSAAVQWLAIALIVFEYWAAPLRLTPVDRPAVYDALAAAPPGAVCEVPLGIGDGLTGGVGRQDRRVLLYATEHAHPLVGGFIGRMPADAADRYRRSPIAGTLLALSDGGPLPAAPDTDASASTCTYLVVDRAAISPSLASYLQLLTAEQISSDGQHDLLRIR